MLLYLLILINGKAQNIDYFKAFSTLDANNIPTGILYDYAYPSSNLLEFDGSNTSVIMDKSQWVEIYQEVLKAYMVSPDIPTLGELHQNLNNFYGQQKVPICIVNLNYNKIKDNAFDDSLLTMVDDQLHEVSNPIESPYETHRYFSAQAIPLNFDSDEYTFTFDPSLYISNTGESIESIEVDFGNGYSFSNLNINSELTLSYSNIGSEIEVVLHLSGNTDLMCNFSIETNDLKSAVISSDADDKIMINNIGYGSGIFGAECGVWFGCETNSLNEIRKPIVVLEGIDATNDRDLSEVYNECNVHNFASVVQANGYDLIVVNWKWGGDLIQGNAMVLRELLLQLSSIMEANGNYNEIVVIGESMGGLVARYALAYMESMGENHHTRLFLSIDAPQQGAYIPYVLQEIIYLGFWTALIAEGYGDTGLFENEAVEKLLLYYFCPAAKQMLVYYRPECISTNPAPSPLRTQLINELNGFGNNGYPTSVDKMVGFSFGSGARDDQGFDPGDIRFSYDGPAGTFNNLKLVAKAIPDNNSLEILKITLTKKVKNPCHDWFILRWFCGKYDSIDIVYSPVALTVSGTLPYENVSGGYLGFTKDFVNRLNDVLGISININLDENDCFIPSVSALNLINFPLDFRIYTLTNGRDYIELNRTAITPFHAIYIESDNKMHDNGSVSTNMMSKMLELIMEDHISISDLSLNNKNAQYEAVRTISVDNTTIQNYSKLNLRAGESVCLQSNVNIEAGCEVTIEARPSCQE